MLTIQPNFSQRLYSQPAFKAKYDYAEDVGYIDLGEAHDTAEFTDINLRNQPVLASSVNNNNSDNELSEGVDESLKGLRDDINDAVKGVKSLEDKLHPAARKSIDALCLVGGGAVVGISTKFGWNETSRVLSKVAKNQSVVKFKENLGKFGKKFVGGFKSIADTNLYKSVATKFSEWGKTFADTKFGGTVCKFFKSINESKFVTAVKNFFGKSKNINNSKVNDTVGDVVAFSTGLSTTVAGAMPDKKKADAGTENIKSVDNLIQENFDEDDYDALVD